MGQTVNLRVNVHTHQSATTLREHYCSSEDLTNDTHSLAHVVEVQNGQQLVGDISSHLPQRDGLGSSGPEDKAKIPCRSDQSSLVR